MANYVNHLLDILLSNKFRDIIDEFGKSVIPSSPIYSTISEITKNDPDKVHYLKPKYIYILLKHNQYGLWNKILEYHNVKIESSLKSNDSLNDTKLSNDII